VADTLGLEKSELFDGVEWPLAVLLFACRWWNIRASALILRRKTHATRCANIAS